MMPLSNESALPLFAGYLRVEKGLARLSVTAYLHDPGEFAGLLKKRRRTLAEARARKCATTSATSTAATSMGARPRGNFPLSFSTNSSWSRILRS
jgi:site-specific recombinase XerD